MEDKMEKPGRKFFQHAHLGITRMRKDNNKYWSIDKIICFVFSLSLNKGNIIGMAMVQMYVNNYDQEIGHI